LHTRAAEFVIDPSMSSADHPAPESAGRSAPPPAPRALAPLEALAARSRNAAATARARAIVDIVAGLTDDADILAGAMLFALREADAISAQAGLEAAGEGASRIADELLRLGSLNIGVGAGKQATLSGQQAEALRKMLLAIVTDPRLVLIRLAVQLHMLRECKDAPPEQRERIAYETREIYAPLANRLGVWQLKWELEDLSFRYLDPANYKRIAGWLAARRADRERYIEQVIALTREELRKAGVATEVAGRPKHIYSIWRKMQRKGLSFEQVYDVRALRVLVDTIADCYAAL